MCSGANTSIRNQISTYKRKASEADLCHSDEGSDNDGSEDEIDIPDDNDSHVDGVLTADAMNNFV